MAGPAQPTWDLAFSAWAFAPIHRPDHARALGAPTDPIRRIRLLCESYGRQDAGGLLALIDARMEASAVGIERMAAAGEPAFRALVEAGHLARIREDQDWLAAHRPEWQVALA